MLNKKLLFRQTSTTNNKTQSLTWCETWLNQVILGIQIRQHVFFDLFEIIENNLNLPRQAKLPN
jgi:hypothetical protein